MAGLFTIQPLDATTRQEQHVVCVTVTEPMDWMKIAEIAYYVAGTVGALGTFLAAGLAVYFYYRNSQLERAKWASGLYEKFYEKPDLKAIRDKLDVEESDPEAIRNLVKDQPSDFTDYLNFFEFIAFLKKSKQLSAIQVEDLFGFT
jgi:hypothetical protein